MTFVPCHARGGTRASAPVQQPRDEPPDQTSGPIVEPMFDADGALSRAFLLRRGFCCDLGCKNCPYRSADDNSTDASRD